MSFEAFAASAVFGLFGGVLAGLFGIGPVMPWALLILTVMAFVTVVQRMSHVHKNTRGAGLDP